MRRWEDTNGMRTPRSACRFLQNSRTSASQGFQVGRTKISDILRSLGYSLQGNRKTREGQYKTGRKVTDVADH